MTSVLEDPAPLQPNYLPQTVMNRKDEQEALNALYSGSSDADLMNVFIDGPRGTGKTHVTRLVLDDLPDAITTCYVPCTRYDTQYKVLKRLCQHLTSKPIGDGHHTSRLQREFGQYVRDVQTVVVLDDIDFLLMNDGDSLLYSLARIEHSQNVGIVLTSANHQDLASRLEERTYSSLYPHRIEFEPYTAEQVYRILVDRARKSLTEQSLRREALTYIAATTSNIHIGLTWLRTAAEAADNTVTEDLVNQLQSWACQNYADELLQSFTDHHRLIYQAIRELTEEHDTPSIRSGNVYDRYQELCQAYSEEALSSRQISDYLKQLELLNLIKVDYHYGGQKGKTREIQLRRL